MQTTSPARNVIANYLGAGYSAIVQVLFVPIYIRYLGIEAYGLIGFYVSMQSVLALMDMGITPTLIREMARFKAGAYSANEIRTLLRTLECVYVGLAAVMLLSVVFAATWLATVWLNAVTLPEVAVSQAISVMAILIAFRWLSGLYRGVILGLQHQVWLNAENAVFATLRAIGIIVVLRWVSATIGAFFIYQGCIALLEMLVLLWKAWSYLPGSNRPTFSRDAVLKVWRFSAGVTAATVFGLLLTQTDKVMLSRLLPLREYGYYMLASTVAAGLSTIVGPLSNASYPRFAELSELGNGLGLATTYHRFSQALGLMLIPAGLVLAIFSNAIMLLWTRNFVTATATAPFVSLLVVGYVLNGLMHIPYNLQLAHGWTRFFVITNALCALVFIPAIYFGVAVYGPLAAGYMWIGINACYLIFALPLMHRKLLRGQLFQWYLVDTLMPAAAAFVALWTVRLLMPNPVRTTAGASFALLALAYSAALLAATGASPLGRDLLVRTYLFTRQRIFQCAAS